MEKHDIEQEATGGALAAIVRELKDRQDILDCIARYCRGMDRLDRAAVESAYHPDAMDDHGEFVGPVAAFIDWAFDYHRTNQLRTAHVIANHLCDLDGDVAHTETYWTFHALNRLPPHHTRANGRYVDRFERRDGRWGIVTRLCLLGALEAATDPEALVGDGPFHPSARDRGDPIYQRPLRFDAARLTATP